MQCLSRSYSPRQPAPRVDRWLAAVLLLLACGTASAAMLRSDTLLVAAHPGSTNPSQLENSLAQMAVTTADDSFMLEFNLKANRDGHLYLPHEHSLGPRHGRPRPDRQAIRHPAGPRAPALSRWPCLDASVAALRRIAALDR